MKTVLAAILALYQLAFAPYMALALSCSGKTCSYEYKYQKRNCRGTWPFRTCSWEDTRYRYCAQKWGSHPQSSYGEIEVIFGDDDRISRISGTGKNEKCEDRDDIETKYANNNSGRTCNMRWDKKKWSNFAYTVPCWDDDARRALEADDNREPEEEVGAPVAVDGDEQSNLRGSN